LGFGFALGFAALRFGFAVEAGAGGGALLWSLLQRGHTACALLKS
jgi:hypothetical protein